MISSCWFYNFRILRDVVLDLTPLTVVVGPNSSGKSTLLQGIELGVEKLGKNSRPLSLETLGPILSSLPLVIPASKMKLNGLFTHPGKNVSFRPFGPRLSAANGGKPDQNATGEFWSAVGEDWIVKGATKEVVAE